MITATEARELVTLSETNVQRLIKLIEPKIKVQAELGKKNLDVYEVETVVRTDGYWSTPKPTPLMEKLLEEIKKFGFNATFITEKQEVRRGGLGFMGDDDGPEPEPTKICYIQIRW